MSKKYQPGESHLEQLIIPGVGRIIVESSEFTASVTWPTDMKATEVLEKLRQTMRIGSDLVTLYFNYSEVAEDKLLNEMKSQKESIFDDLGVARIDDHISGYGVIWQRPLGLEKNYEAGISARHLEQVKLTASLAATGNEVLTSQVDELTQMIMDQLHIRKN